MTPLFRSSADVLAELSRMQGLLDQVFRPSGPSSIRLADAGSFPALNVGTTPGSVEVMALAPGLDPQKIEVTVDRGLLVIAGERRGQLPTEGERHSIHARERFAGRFRRVVTLPDDADAARVEASYRDGILRISIAKCESSQPRRVEVQ